MFCGTGGPEPPGTTRACSVGPRRRARRRGRRPTRMGRMRRYVGVGGRSLVHPCLVSHIIVSHISFTHDVYRVRASRTVELLLRTIVFSMPPPEWFLEAIGGMRLPKTISTTDLRIPMAQPCVELLSKPTSPGSRATPALHRPTVAPRAPRAPATRLGRQPRRRCPPLRAAALCQCGGAVRAR